MRSYTASLSQTPQQKYALFETLSKITVGTAVLADFLLNVIPLVGPALVDEKAAALAEGKPAEYAAFLKRSYRLSYITACISPEDSAGASVSGSAGFIITAPGQSLSAADAERIIDEILDADGVSDADTRRDWKTDCLGSLTARISDSSVLVNRHKAARALVQPPLSADRRQESRLAFSLSEKAYGGRNPFLMPPPKKPKDDRENSDSDSDEREDDFAEKNSEPDLTQKASSLYSEFNGSGERSQMEKTSAFASELRAKLLALPKDGDKPLPEDALKNALKDIVRSTNAGVFPAQPPETLAEKCSTSSMKMFFDRTVNGIKACKLAYLFRDLLFDLDIWTPWKNIRDEWDANGRVKKMLALAVKNLIDTCAEESGKNDRLLDPPAFKTVLVEIRGKTGIDLLDRGEDAPGLRLFGRAMMGYAMRRVAQRHSAALNQEAERQECSRKLDAIKATLAALDPEGGAQAALKRFEESRRVTTGSGGGYAVSDRAIRGASDVAKAFAACRPEERLARLKEIQDRSKRDFGDSALFEFLASDDADCPVLKPNGEWSDKTLRAWVDMRSHEMDVLNLRRPAFHHPDPFSSPCFPEYGSSQLKIEFSLQKTRRAEIKAASPGKARKRQKAAKPSPAENTVSFHVLDYGGRPVQVSMRWVSSRIMRDFAPQSGFPDPKLPRNDKIGRAVAAIDGSAMRPDAYPAAPFGDKDWNGRLTADWRMLSRIGKCKDPAKRRTMIEKLRWHLGMGMDVPAAGGTKRIFNETFREEIEKLNERNKGRGRYGTVPYGVIPGTRFLSVDLGIRNAAACAVLMTVTDTEVSSHVLAARQKGWPVEGSVDGLHVVIQAPGKKAFRYRRTGLLTWVRLERGFIIPIDGERDRPRAATDEETAAIAAAEHALGFAPAPAARLIDAFLKSAIWNAKAAVRRHNSLGAAAASILAADAASVANGLLALWKLLQPDPKRRSFRQDTELAGAWGLLAAKGAPPLDAQEPKRAGVAEALRQTAAALMGDLISREKIHGILSAVWENQKLMIRKHVRLLDSIILPARKEIEARGLVSIKNSGGLSDARIDNVEALHIVKKALFTGVRPDGSSATLPIEFDQKTLRTLKRMRDNKVKNLVSKIVQAALGAGRRPHNGARFAPCHFIVIENLKSFKTSAKRSRYENRSLTRWGAATIRKLLEDSAELNGIGLRMVGSRHTSRQDWLTGMPGTRFSEMTVATFRNSWVQSEVRTARAKLDARESLNAYERCLIDLDDMSLCLKDTQTLRVPVKGGVLFISADGRTSHADINAAGNIGLKFALDPDFQASHWRVLCKDGVVSKKEYAKTPLFTPLPDLKAERSAPKGQDGNEKEYWVWRDPSVKPLEEGPWRQYTEYWRHADERSIGHLRRMNKNVVNPH